MIRRLLGALALAFVALPAAAQDLAVETAQVEDISAVRQIKHIQARWSHMGLAGNWKGMAEMAAPDVELDLPYGVISGRGGLESWLRTTQGGGAEGMAVGRLNAHLWYDPVMTLAPDGQSARVRWHEYALTGTANVRADWLGQVWVVDYAKGPDGWKIVAMKPYFQFAGPYENGGWHHDPDTLVRPPYHYEPEDTQTLIPERRAATAMSQDQIDRTAHALRAETLALNVVNAYGFYLDRKMFDDVADLFADDAKIEMGGIGAWEGKPAIRSFLTRFGTPGLEQGEFADRPQFMPMINIAADGSMALIRNIELGMIAVPGEGYWQLTMQTFMLRPGADGKWRIALMHRSPIMRADFATGWTHPLPAALPTPAGGEPNTTTNLGSVDFRDNAYGVPPLGESFIMPVRGEPAAFTPDPNALAEAIAADSAENVVNAYGYYIDNLSYHAMARLFAEDGWREQPHIGIIAGRDRILWASMLARGGVEVPLSTAFQPIHSLLQPYVTVLDGGTRAQVRVRLLQFGSGARPPASWITAVYEWQVKKVGDSWQLAGMDLDYTSTVNALSGWAGAELREGGVGASSPEQIARYDVDAPLRGGESGYAFPKVYELGFHYANPVSGREPPRRIEWTEVKPKER